MKIVSVWKVSDGKNPLNGRVRFLELVVVRLRNAALELAEMSNDAKVRDKISLQLLPGGSGENKTEEMNKHLSAIKTRAWYCLD